MEDARLLEISLTQDQRDRLIKALRNLAHTIVNVATETGLPLERGGRLLIMSITLQTISYLADIMDKALNKYVEKIAEELGLEPSP